ncbi:MAG: DNA polymerase II large subunit, partial [Candidatus Nanoarchaeia archaeon]
GAEYFCLYFGGPIRSAGTTATCIFAGVADYVRINMGYHPYDPTEDEIKRTYSEMEYYHERITNLQYFPSEKEAVFLTTHLPIQIDGDPSEKIETPNYKDLPRVSTNFLRNGFCLVMAEGLAQKFPKFWGKFSKWNKEFGMDHWDFLEDFVKLQKEIKSKGAVKKDTSLKIAPDYTYIKDLVAGRPILGHPLRTGAFRLRYGRARTSGFSSDALHPATMCVLENYIAIGTQLKTERPGKATTISSCDSIEGPIVKLKDGSVVFLENTELAKKHLKEIKEIIFVGDILINYGDFLDRGHSLVPVGYNEDWWVLELEKALGDNKTLYEKLLNNPTKIRVPLQESYTLSKTYNIPLHPRYTYHWADLNKDQLKSLIGWLQHAVIKPSKIIIPFLSTTHEHDPKRSLELIGAPHQVVTGEYVVLEDEWADALKIALGFYSKEENFTHLLSLLEQEKSMLEIINDMSEVVLRDKSGTFIGSRMGRPEKAKERELTGTPHALFPVGKEGGRLRSFQAAMKEGKIIGDFPLRYCTTCNKEDIADTCITCGNLTIQKYSCKTCGIIETDCGHEPVKYGNIPFPIYTYFEATLKKLGIRNVPELIKGVRGVSNPNHYPEPLAKGILRAVHDVHVNKDGTTRYDMIEMPLTHFKPKEIGTSIAKLKEIGYTHDVYGQDLINEEQIVELKCQDLILPACVDSQDKGADLVLTNVANFIDDLLEKFYGLPRFYNIKKREDLVGHIVIGLSPHTAAGIVCRIAGFSRTQAMLAHPLLHSIMRRDCVAPTTKLLFFDQHNILQYKKIGPFVESLLEEGCPTKTLDPLGTVSIIPKQEYYTYGADPETKELVKKKIKYFIKGPVTPKWIKLTTCTNRELLMTPNHDFMYLDEKDNFCFKKAKEITEGDKLLIMDYFRPELISTKLDLVQEFATNLPPSEKHKFRLTQCSEFFKTLVKNYGVAKIRQTLNITQKRFSFSRWYPAVPFNHLEQLIAKQIITYDQIPTESKIKYWFSNKEFSRHFIFTPYFSRLLGTYFAEGHCRQNKTTRQVSFRVCHPSLIDDLVLLIKICFNLQPTLEENNTKITISHSFVHAFFKYILKTGTNAKNKQIPSLVYQLPDKQILEFVSAYLDGDGSIIEERNALCFYSTNRSLLDDFALLLARFHIIGRYSTTAERLPGKTLLDRYLELGLSPKKFKLHHFVINGIDVHSLGTKLNLYHPEKRKKLQDILMTETDSRLIKVNHTYQPLHSFGDAFIDFVKKVEIIEDSAHSYCVEVEWNKKEERNVIWGEQIINTRCDGDEACVLLLMDGFLNFSRELLSDHRGATQDEPLVLTSQLLPAEVDDMVFNMDICFKYPLELYEAALLYKPASEVKVETLRARLKTPGQYEGMGFTHDTEDFNNGVRCSQYKLIPNMEGKVLGQMTLAEKLRAVDTADVARLIIERHFIRDIKGNLKKFSQQEFRCVECNAKFRRPPLKGSCTTCSGKLLFTISEGSVIKYLEPCLSLADKYDLPAYLKQTLELTRQRIDLFFGKEKDKQEGLGRWFG